MALSEFDKGKLRDLTYVLVDLVMQDLYRHRERFQKTAASSPQFSKAIPWDAENLLVMVSHHLTRHFLRKMKLTPIEQEWQAHVSSVIDEMITEVEGLDAN